MDGNKKKLVSDLVISALIIVAGFAFAVLSKKDIVRICGLALVVIEVISVVRSLMKWRNGDKK